MCIYMAHERFISLHARASRALLAQCVGIYDSTPYSALKLVASGCQLDELPFLKDCGSIERAMQEGVE